MGPTLLIPSTIVCLVSCLLNYLLLSYVNMSPSPTMMVRSILAISIIGAVCNVVSAIDQYNSK